MGHGIWVGQEFLLLLWRLVVVRRNGYFGVHGHFQNKV